MTYDSNSGTGSGKKVAGERRRSLIFRYGDYAHIHRLFTMTMEIA